MTFPELISSSILACPLQMGGSSHANQKQPSFVQTQKPLLTPSSQEYLYNLQKASFHDDGGDDDDDDGDDDGRVQLNVRPF